MTVEKISVESVLKENKCIDGGWFWSKYSVNPYIGCKHGCSYCFLRSNEYGMKKDNFSCKIAVKMNSPEVLDRELKNKRKDIILISGYQEIDEEYQLTRKLLEVCYRHRFPVIIVTKSPLVVRDTDILEKISKTSWACVVFSIASHRSEGYLEFFEPGSPSIEDRFEALEKLCKSGIYAGTALIPVLPFITDNNRNIELVVKETKNRGGRFLIAGGLVLSDKQKENFLDSLKSYNSDLVDKYHGLYRDLYSPSDDSWAKIGNRVKELCLSNDIPYRIKRYIPESPLNMNKRLSEQLFLNIYELELQGKKEDEMKFFRELACLIDEYPVPVTGILDRKEVELISGKPSLAEVKNLVSLLQERRRKADLSPNA